ncbi:MAG: hypothetical protein Alpg2KO_30300 [Alphaproteobacteria bacterium]
MSTQSADKIEPLSRDAVRALKARAAKRLAAQLDAALPEDADPDVRKALNTTLRRLIHARNRPTPAKLKDMAGWSIDGIQRAGRAREPWFSLKETRDFIASSPDQLYRSLADHVFEPGEYRQYLPLLQAEPSDLQKAVESHLTEAGFTEIDYKKGTCLDDRKQVRKIGRLLNTPETSRLFEQFSRDSSRQADRQLVVLSRHPYDVIRMSTGRGWESCMSKRGMYGHLLGNEVKQGSLVAYLVSENDPNINDPMARIALKPYRNEDGETVWKPGPQYGLRSKLFERTLTQYADQTLNFDKLGHFRRADVYGDGMPGITHLIPPDCSDLDAETFFKALGIRYNVDEETGKLHLPRGLNLDGCKLTHLPDLSNVVCRGLVLSNNPLTSLKGCPEEVFGDFVVSRCGLTSLEHGPRKVTGTYNCAVNPLKDLTHAAEHAGSLDARSCELTSLTGLPEQIDQNILLSDNTDLTSLKGLPPVVGGWLALSKTGITDLTHAPQDVGGLYLDQCSNLQSLQGCPTVVRGNFTARQSGLTTLKHGPQRVHGFYDVSQNRLERLDGMADWVGRGIELAHNPLTSLKGLPAYVNGDLNLCNTNLTTLKGGPEAVNGSIQIAGTPDLLSLRDGPWYLRGGVKQGYYDRRGFTSSLSLNIGSMRRGLMGSFTNWDKLFDAQRQTLPPLRPHPRDEEAKPQEKQKPAL